VIGGRVVSPVFVGRGAELSRLEGVLQRAAAGEPAVVIVAGEAGVGKSRLVAELLAARAPPDARVLVGDCSGFAPGSLPYEPIVRLLRRLVRSAAGEPDLLERAQQVLRVLLPELVPPGAADAGGRDPPPEQAQVFSQLEAVFDTMAAAAPPVLVIEDLHWADRSSLEFLSYFCHGLHHQRIAIVCTYRDDEVPAAPVLGAWLADRRHDPRLTEISLARFTMAELSGQVAAILGQAADPELVTALHARSQGNAYYTEMLLAAADVHAGGDTTTAEVPPALREALLARSAGVAAGTRDLLAVIAAAGHPVDHASAAAACARFGMGQEQVMAGLREAADHHLLVPVTDPPGYAFRHALLAEATYDQLLPGERQRLHGVWAGVLEERVSEGGNTGSGVAAEIAVHHHNAGHRRAAFGWDLRAAQAAGQVGGFAEAASCYRRMLSAWDGVRDAEQEAAADRAEILTRLAQAEELAGDVGSVHLHIQDALKLVDPASEPARAATLLDRLSWALYIAGQHSAALDAATAAVELVPESPPSLARVVVRTGQGRVQMLAGRGAQASAAALEATALASQLGEPIALALAIELQARVAWLNGRPESVALARQALRMGQRIGIQDITMIAFDGLAEALDATGNDRGVFQVCNGGYERTRRLGGANYGAWLLCRACFNLIASGHTAKAANALRTAMRVRPSGILDVYGQLCVAQLATLRGDFDAGRAAIDRCRRGAPELRPPFAPRYCAAAAELELWAGDAERAFAAAEEGLASVARTDFRRHAGTIAWLALRTAADRADSARARQDTAAITRALVDAERTQRTLADGPWFTAEPETRARALRALIDAEHSRLAGHSDPERWARAARCSRACSRPHQAGYAAWRQAEALLAQHGHRAAAATCLRDSHALAARISAQPLQGEIEALARYARIDLGAPTRQEEGPLIAPPLQSLTRRERDVLDGLAVGLTNRQIADRLYISPRTAAVHVSHVLHKLGVPDRVQAAHLARQLQRR
jgi:DNA-binding CsgD family transcriptional regulator/tetratricopeptide (TPR) repeat protein